MQQRQLAQDYPGANLDHRLTVHLCLEHPIEQQEQLLALLTLLDQDPAHLEPPEPRLGINDGD
jgi:hypothetical protein